METRVLEQHHTHFSQAEGMVFTQEPLQTLINDNCTSKFAQQVLNGTAELDTLPINEYTKDLLWNLKSKISPTEHNAHPLNTNALIQGFIKVWPECTTTSPSWQHLGIYKSLAKHFPTPPDKNAPIPATPPDPIQCGNDILKLLITMMDLAIKHTHTYKRWKTIWTLLLEKDPGNPQINWLCTIHLYEANYNLLLKWFSSKGFILGSEKVHWITNHQGGGCAGQCTNDLAITKVLSFKIADTMHMHIIVIDNDATACFDCMIEAPSNLACLQHGTDPQYIKLHAQTQKELKYHLKHKYGISEEYNTHSPENPWHGMGQGAGDASNHWVIGLDSMLDAYTHKAHGWIIPSPSQQPEFKQMLKAFIDNVNLFIGQTPHTDDSTFLSMAQDDINQWHGILHATGGD